MEQIYQWFEYRKSNWRTFSLYLEIVVKGGWLERTRARNRNIQYLKLSITHTKACCNLLWYGLKPALLTSHTIVDPLI